MGTEIELFVDTQAPDGPMDEAEREFRRLELILSRFLPDSELSRLNRARVMRVGPELAELVPLAIAARTRTNGRFDPTVHNAVVSAGYDRTFELVPGRCSRPPRVAPAPCSGDVEIHGDVVVIEAGFALDLGGIAKGWAADRACAILASAGPALVDAGGDLVGVGRTWPIGIPVPAQDLTLGLRDGALATSGRDRRRWTCNGHEAHHVIDPATGEPADGDVLTVTVAARTAAEAEVLATALFLSGEAERAAREADADAVPAVIVARDGRALLAGGLA
jgi:thiamine biosynthesis lipoprotein